MSMPFQYTLANLLARNDRAIAVLFLDETGETVDFACSEQTPFQMKLAGAYVGIYLRQLIEVFGQGDFGRAELLHIEKDDIQLHAAPLPDGYYLVLVQKQPALVARARQSLLDARDEIAREIFEGSG
jgi:hypothetical protein